ncbi:J domain-containing protein [Hymenobacter nivis]|uniref:J domain-containing protein n=1 Tax=Hymenobacter nivis TaxID=1850093 RepID=UPI001128EA48|nr:J domain-containing protein [Hymenobacter nivis]
MSQTHYQVLGVAPTASAADVKRAYRQLVVRYHPDKHGGDVRYEEQFKAVATAYRVLGDAGRRATYDFQLAQATRRADDERRQQQYRPAGQHVYGVPMPPPAPLRTRPPAGSRERHYQTIPRQRVRFVRRDWLLTLAFLAATALFSLSVKATMDRVTSNARYREGLADYGRGKFTAAYSEFSQALDFRPTAAGALRRRGELQLLAFNNPAAACADLLAARQQENPPAVVAQLCYYLGRCETALGHPARADAEYSAALVRAPALGAAWLARGQGRLLDLGRPAAALADFDRSLAQAQAAGQPGPWRAAQLRGLALATLSRYPEARAAYEAALLAHPRDGQTHFLLGRLAQHLGDTTAACEFFRRSLELGYAFAGPAYEQYCP